MARTNTYLNFPCTTEEAFNFYKSIFGGEFGNNGIARFGDIPPHEGMPPLTEIDKNLVMHIELPIVGGHVLMGTDAPESMGFKVNFGNNINISLEPDTKAETERIFNALAAGGQIIAPLQDMFWGAYYGNCIDKYGVQWMFNCIEKKTTTTDLIFKVGIKAKADRVWFALWDELHYRTWTNAFCENNYFVGDWTVGSKIHFLTPSGEGMYSQISANVPNEKMYITHIGEIKNFEEQPLDENSRLWTGAQENYALTAIDDITILEVMVQTVADHVDFFEKSFPKGLAVVKQLAENLSISITAEVNAPIEKAWAYWTTPNHIKNWNNASDDWHTPKAENDLQIGGAFVYTMAAKDGSMAFDFKGIYTHIAPLQTIEYILEDDRKVQITFEKVGDITKITESFNPENVNSLDLQKSGWQAILNNFKRYTEQG